MSFSIDDIDECYAVYDEQDRKARKLHECAACKEIIPAGHRYKSIHTVFDGSAETIKRCLRCQALHEHLRELAPGETWPDERLNCGREYEKEWGREPPEDVIALAFVTPQEMQEKN